MIKQTRKRIDYSGLSIQTLKVELAICGVNTDDLLEKPDLVKALEDLKRTEKNLPAPRKTARSSYKACQSKHTMGDKVLYISSNGEIAESSSILEVHWTEGDAPYYIIQLDVSGRERQTDDAHLVALPGKQSECTNNKNVESPSQTESKSDGKLKKAFENLKHLTSTSRSSRSSVEPKSRSLPLRASSFSLSLPSRKKDDLSTSSRHSSKSVDPKRTRSLPLRASSFSMSSHSRRKDDLSTASTDSTSSSGSSFSFFHHKPEKPQRRSTRSISSTSSPTNYQRPALRPARPSVIGVHPIKSVRRSSPGSYSVSSITNSSMRSSGSQFSGHREQVYKSRRASSRSPCNPASVSGFADPKVRAPPARSSSFSVASSSRQRREKRHSLRPSPSRGKENRPALHRTASLTIN